uniref:Uncharacterized protein n=1 Tax=Octopus bimaculoides TaxID=37653 RepID=A0A0L8FIR3_OCTBM
MKIHRCHQLLLQQCNFPSLIFFACMTIGDLRDTLVTEALLLAAQLDFCTT